MEQERLVTMEMAVAQGKQAIENMTSASSSAQNVIRISAAVKDRVNPIVDSWDSLLGKLKTFSEFGKTVAEVEDQNDVSMMPVTNPGF